jgi:DNA-binding Lrp family transcriptional regulator
MKPKKDLDRKDLDIIRVLDTLGPKTSTQQISQALNIPDRTIRYRLKYLKENKYLQPLYPLIYDRKLGLGEHIVLLQEVESAKTVLNNLIMEIPYYYWINSTYGKYNGFLFNSIYSLENPTNNNRLCETLKKEGLISDFYLFDVKFFKITYPNLSFFDPKDGWTWDWIKWYYNIEERLKKGEWNEDIEWEREPKLAEFDFKDIKIIKNLKKDPNVTLRDLGEILDLSERQIRRRIKRLEQERIIRGYISTFTPKSHNESLLTYFFFELNDPEVKIQSFFHELPFQLDFFIESENKHCICFRASIKDIIGFTKAIELFKPFFSSTFLQIVPYTISERHHLFEAYNKEKKCWETPVDKYIERIKTDSSQGDQSSSR